MPRPDPDRLGSRLPALPQTQAAVAFAERRHAGQIRADGSEFILHPLETGSLLHSVGAPDRVIAAGVLHDVLEKSEATVPELQERFGPHITALVLALTEDERVASYKQRKALLRQQVGRAGPDALAVFAADKLSKLRELRRRGIDRVRARRFEHYQRSAALLEELLPDSPLVSQLHDELVKLRPDRRSVAG